MMRNVLSIVAVCGLIWFASMGDARAEAITVRHTSGPVAIDVSLEPESPLIGDPVKLVIRVVAEQDVEVLMPDFGAALNRFAIVDFAPRRSVDAEGRTVATQTYRLEPPSSGRQVIPPILIEYIDRRAGQQPAPEGLDAYEVLTERIVFEVQSVLPNSASADLKPPLGELAPIEPARPSRWPWWIAAGIVSLALAVLLVRVIRSARRRQRRRSAYDVARGRLEKLLHQSRQNADEVEQFYVGLSYVIRQYIEDRFEMRAPELTTEEFLGTIGQSPDFSSDHQGLLREFLRQADLVKFARAEPSAEQIDRSIGLAKRFLDETRENAPLVQDEDAESSQDDDADSRAKQEVVHG